ncbi:MAG: hypothetical protein LBP19_02985 [Treponema sp.]|jgi:hypothetical protein|nr:hypothetical protein [Treponema sp.]
MLISKENESELLAQILAYLAETHFKESEDIKNELSWLETLEKVMLRHPDVKISWENNESLDMFNKILSSNTLCIPPKVMNIHTYLGAKLHIFSTLFEMLQDIAAFRVPLRTSMLTITSLFTIEKVYSSCLRDNFMSRKVKTRLADELIALWNTRLNIKDACFLCHLEQLWIARDKTPPTYGTLDGNSETLRLSIELPKEWDDFLIEQEGSKETGYALQEFIFGLSYEDLIRERERLSRIRIQSVNEVELKKVFGARAFAFTSLKNNGPTRFYDFFLERDEKSLFRRHISSEGPNKTIEVLYLEYLTSKL